MTPNWYSRYLQYLGKVKSIEWCTLLHNLLHGTSFLSHLLGLLCKEEVQDGHSSVPYVTLRQAVDHQHHPHGPLALPVTCRREEGGVLGGVGEGVVC